MTGKHWIYLTAIAAVAGSATVATGMGIVTVVALLVVVACPLMVAIFMHAAHGLELPVDVVASRSAPEDRSTTP